MSLATAAPPPSKNTHAPTYQNRTGCVVIGRNRLVGDSGSEKSSPPRRLVAHSHKKRKIAVENETMAHAIQSVLDGSEDSEKTDHAPTTMATPRATAQNAGLSNFISIDQMQVRRRRRRKDFLPVQCLVGSILGAFCSDIPTSSIEPGICAQRPIVPRSKMTFANRYALTKPVDLSSITLP